MVDLQRQTLAVQREDVGSSPALPADIGSRQARGLLADALYLARYAAASRQGPRRSALLERARAKAVRASEARVHWGEAWLVRAYIAALRQPLGDEPLVALERSYRDAPFLRHGAEWRLEYGISRWSALHTDGKRRLIDEAVVFGQLNPDAARRVFSLARGTGAYFPLIDRWNEIQRTRWRTGQN